MIKQCEKCGGFYSDIVGEIWGGRSCDCGFPHTELARLRAENDELIKANKQTWAGSPLVREELIKLRVENETLKKELDKLIILISDIQKQFRECFEQLKDQQAMPDYTMFNKYEQALTSISNIFNNKKILIEAIQYIWANENKNKTIKEIREYVETHWGKQIADYLKLYDSINY